MPDGEPSRKRARLDDGTSSAASPVVVAPAVARAVRIGAPSAYVLPHVRPTPFQQPAHLASFSYSPARELLLDAKRKDEALAWYREPHVGVDLNLGFRDAVHRDASVDEGLDALLDCLREFAHKDEARVLDRAQLITWRGMVTKLVTAVYETDNARQRVGFPKAWKMNAMVVNGTLYLEEDKAPATTAKKAVDDARHAIQSYYGYSFESFCTARQRLSTPPPTRPYDPNATLSQAHLANKSGSQEAFEVPNENVQWCSVVKTTLGSVRMVIGGEVDCVRADAHRDEIETKDFIELKTNMVIRNQKDEVNFERNKLLKHYIQSFLLGIPKIVVGFRTRDGILSAVQHFKTLELPRLVRGKSHGWNPLACLASGDQLISSIRSHVASHPSTVKYEEALHRGETDEDLTGWPVFRVVFSPTTEAAITIQELSREQIEAEVISAKRQEERVGFLLKRWVDDVVRAHVDRAKESNGNDKLQR